DAWIELGKLFMYLGLFLIPIVLPLLPAIPKAFRKAPRLTILAAAVSGALVGAVMVKLYFLGHRFMPFTQNLLRIPTLGASTIMGVSVAPLAHRYRSLITYVSAVAAALLLSYLIFAIKCGAHLCRRALGRRQAPPTGPISNRAMTAVVSFSALLLSCALVLSQTMVVAIDRYYVMPLVPVIVCICLSWRWLRIKFHAALACLLVILFGAYSTCAEQDYMAWNRARWQALSELEQNGVHSSEIDGGMEYNFWRDIKLGADLDLHGTNFFNIHRGEKPRSSWRWWSINGERYIISFSPVPDYEVVATHRYFSALTMSYHEIYTLKSAKN
ncbi:MAG TPA: hypothetical protein V6C72_08955, partial [Chroococcales cyanobacterium]